MKSIVEYLKAIRREIILHDIKVTCWIIYSVVLALFVLGLMFESVFYFSSYVRFAVWIMVLGITLIGVSWLIIIAQKIRRNLLQRYSWSHLAKNAGKYAFPKDDTLINALQIEESAKESSSKELSTAFIQEISKKLAKLDLSKLFPLHRVETWKQVTLIGLTITIFLLAITWKHSVSSLYRWSHPNTEFVPPKPFLLKGTSRHMYVLGGENVTVSFSALGEIPDSVYIEFKPIAFEPGRDSLILETVFPSKQKDVFSAELKEVFQNYRYDSLFLDHLLGG